MTRELELVGSTVDDAMHGDAWTSASEWTPSSLPLPENIDNRHWSRSLALWLVAIYIALFLIRPWEVITPWLADLRFERVYAVVMIAVVFLTGRRIPWNSQSISVAVFSLAVALSAVCAYQSSLSWIPLYQYLTVVVMYYLMISVCRRPRDLLFLITAYVATMCAYLGKSLWEYFVHDRHEFAQSVTRLIGIETTFGEPNAVAMSAVLSLPLWMFMYRVREDMTCEWGRNWRMLYRVAIVVYPLLVFVAVWLTNSRAGMIGLGAFVVGSRWMRVDRPPLIRVAMIALLLLIGLWAVTPNQQKDRLRTLWDRNVGTDNARASAAGRWEGLMAATEMVSRHPATGVGVGNFVAYRVSYLDGVALVAHNLPGQILGEMGFLGGIAFAWMVGVTWFNTRRIVSACRDDESDTAFVFHELALALQLTILLLLLFGMSLHNGLRFNWLWIAAFASVALQFVEVGTDDEDFEPAVE